MNGFRYRFYLSMNLFKLVPLMNDWRSINFRVRSTTKYINISVNVFSVDLIHWQFQCNSMFRRQTILVKWKLCRNIIFEMWWRKHTISLFACFCHTKNTHTHKMNAFNGRLSWISLKFRSKTNSNLIRFLWKTFRFSMFSGIAFHANYLIICQGFFSLYHRIGTFIKRN